MKKLIKPNIVLMYYNHILPHLGKIFLIDNLITHNIRGTY